MKTKILVENAAGIRTLEPGLTTALRNCKIPQKHRIKKMPFTIEGIDFERVSTVYPMISNESTAEHIQQFISEKIKNITDLNVEYKIDQSVFILRFKYDSPKSLKIGSVIKEMNLSFGSKLKPKCMSVGNQYIFILSK